MMYRQAVQELDAKGNALFASGRKIEALAHFLEAGYVQQSLVKPIGRRYLNAQWVWAYGHIGTLVQLIRWFRKHEPGTELILETQNRISNPHYLAALAPFLTIATTIDPALEIEAMDNAVYFASPDGEHSLENFCKLVELECERLPLQAPDVDDTLKALCVSRPYTALHARWFNHDPGRNVSLEQVFNALMPVHNVICIGLDQHPANRYFPSVLSLPDPARASFELSAACDRFVGSDSGAWTVANAYGKPVTLMNDFERKAWIYPEPWHLTDKGRA